jgi:hypothetical protein
MSRRLHRLPRRRDDVRLNDGELHSYLMVPEEGVSHELNAMARAVWELCDGTTTIGEVVDAICQLFDVERGIAVADVVAVVDQLEAAKLVEPAALPEVAAGPDN